MHKISEVIKIYPGMSSTVNLLFEFSDIDSNRKRMGGYKPIRSHREIFLKIAKSMMPNENKVYLLTGHYGTGKSHLLLMLANYFSQTLEMPEIKEFFKNFSIEDESTANTIKSIRGNGRYLVVIPDYQRQEDFSEILLTALESALKRESVEEELNSVYKEALRLIEKWENISNEGKDTLNVYNNFKELLEKKGVGFNSVSLIKEALKNYERNALIIFKDIYKSLYHIDFRFDTNNIIDILKDLIESETFNERFKGIVVLYDEFDYSLKNSRISVDMIQQFAELCKNTNKIIFIGSLHKSLSAYSTVYSETDFLTVQERFKPIDVQRKGLEEIAGAIVKVENNNPIFKGIIEPQLPVLYQKIPDLQRLKLFDWLSIEEIKNKIIDSVYPLHPLTMACLLSLSTTIGSSNRTLFTFLGGEGIDEDNHYSYKSFIQNNEILVNGILNVYLPDLLVKYFDKELDINNVDLRDTIKKSISAYNASLKQFFNIINNEDSLFDKDDPLYEKILNLMLVFEIIGTIPNNEINLKFGLNLQPVQERKFKKILKELKQNSVIFYNEPSSSYEFRRGTDIDWDSLIITEKQKLLESGEINIGEVFLKIFESPEYSEFLDAKKYNTLYQEDRRLLRIFEESKNFGRTHTNDDGIEIEYFTHIENEYIINNNWKDGSDGVVIYVIAQSKEEIVLAREIAKKNISDYIICVIPENPIEITDEFLTLKAVLNIQKSELYSSSPVADQSRFDSSYLGDTNSGYVKKYNDNRNKYLCGKFSTWYGKDGKLIENVPNNEQEPVNKFLKGLYPKSNKVNDEDLNKCHKLLQGNKKTIFKEAIDWILKAEYHIKIDVKFGRDRGFIRYLKNVFYNNRVLSKVESNNNEILCEVNKDLNSFNQYFSALGDMITELKEKNEVKVTEIINKYRYAPYGLGPVALSFFICFLLKYFGDELIYKNNESDVGEITLNEYDQIEDIIYNPNNNAVFQKRQLDNVQKEYLTEVFKTFSKDSLSVDQIPPVRSVISVIGNWFTSLPNISKSTDFYKDSSKIKLITLLKTISQFDNYNFLFEQLKLLAGYEEDDKFTKEIASKIITILNNLKAEAESKISEIEDNLFNKFLQIFSVEGQTYDDLADYIALWYNNLDNNQKETGNLNNDSKPLITYLRDTQNLRETLYKSIPGSNSYGLGKLEDWNCDNSEIYMKKINNGLNFIEESRIKVGDPIFETEGEYEKKEHYGHSTVYKYKDKNTFKFKIRVPDNAKKVFVTLDESDPKLSNSARLLISNIKQIDLSKSNVILRIISENENKEFSKEIKIQLIEEFVGTVRDNLYTFEINKPKNINEVNNSIKDLIYNFIEKENYNKSEIIKILELIVINLRNEN